MILQEVKANGDKVNFLLHIVSDELQSETWNKALIAAAENGNHVNVAKLIIKGAKNIEKALEVSKKLQNYSVQAMLLLLKSAQENDKILVKKLLDGSVVSLSFILQSIQ